MQFHILMRRLVLLLVCLSSCALLAQTANDEFTIVALPDTQFYSKTYPQIFAAQTTWIADHVVDQNIKLVVGLGDIVDGGGELTQWHNADAAVSILDGKVPYMMAIGNHDYDRNNPSGRTGSTHNFNTFFGPARYANSRWYRGSFPAGSNENFYGVVNINGTNYLVLVLEFAPRDSALAWAASVLNANPDKQIIIVTHMFTYSDNTRFTHCDVNNAGSFGVGQDNNGDDIWWKLLRHYPNVHLVLSGHDVTRDGTGRREDVGTSGNLVNQILSDYQSEPLGGGGYLRIMKISPSLNRIRVTTYSPYLDSFKTDSHNQFTAPYRSTGVKTAAGTISGKVQNVINCAPMPGVTISYSGGTAVTDTNGNFSVPASATNSYPIAAKKPGWLTNAVSATSAALNSSSGSPTKILASTAGRIAGTVRDTAGAAITGATVRIRGGGLNASITIKTDSNGAYSTGWTAIGNYAVTTAASGYASGAADATVSAGATTKLDVVLQ